MEASVQELVKKLTLEEKAAFCSGLDMWHTVPVERLGIPSVMMTDGPHGLRKQAGESDHLGLNESVPATCFPSGAGLASSWDPALLRRVGEALGDEAQANGVSIVLGPAVNIKRSPLCGRNFEYFSEDPFLAGELAAEIIEGIQSRGVGTSIKHFAVNNQEHRRMSVDARVDERTLREIYLAGFERAIRKAKPWTVMCSYNRINGVYSSDNRRLLGDVLRGEWGFGGCVMSDWGAVNDRVQGIRAGLDLEMPSSSGAGPAKIIEAVKDGSLPEKELDRCVGALLRVVLKAAESRKTGAGYDREAHHRLARKAAAECMVLLKNEGGLLPFAPGGGKIAVIGDFAQHPRYQGGGSSHINPTRVDAALDAIREIAGPERIVFARGFDAGSEDEDPALLAQAVGAAKDADAVVIFAGLPERFESEGFDRANMNLPENQNRLIEAVAAVQKKTAVVLSNGSPVAMPWLREVAAVLEGYLGGQASGGAAADLLFGRANPSGRLAETFPLKLSDNPSYLNFPGEGDRVEYREGLFVGYRYYDRKEMRVLFPFGHGLSYTTFAFTGIEADHAELKDGETLTVRVRVKNTGAREGLETVQLYVRDPESSVVRPEKELKGFAKVALAPGEEKTAAITLDRRAFAFYDVNAHDWRVESGAFELLAGGSSADLPLRLAVRVQAPRPPRTVFTANSTLGDVLADPRGEQVLRQTFSQAGGLFAQMQEDSGLAPMMSDMVLRAIVSFAGGRDAGALLEKLLAALNAQA